jgi:F-type H+-transporting ATPase subunit b
MMMAAAPANGLPAFLNDPYTWTSLSLVIFFGILAFFGVHKSITGALDKRAADIAKELERARALREAAERMRYEAEVREREAAAQAENMLAQARLEASALVKSAREELARKLERREAQANARIARAEAEAQREVRQAAADAAAAIAERLMLDAAGNQSGFEQALKELDTALVSR